MSQFDVDTDLSRRMENMSELVKRLGLDPITASRRCGGSVFGSAVRVCEACPATETCRDWLMRAAATLYKAPAFCPNADRFAQLIAEEQALPRPKAE